MRKTLLMLSFVFMALNGYSADIGKECIGNWKIDVDAMMTYAQNKPEFKSKSPEEQKQAMAMMQFMKQMLSKMVVGVAKDSLNMTMEMGGNKRTQSKKFTCTKAEKNKYSVKFDDGTTGVLESAKDKLTLHIKTAAGKEEKMFLVKGAAVKTPDAKKESK